MIVISAGMVKSGSLWYYRMTNDLLAHAGLRKDLESNREKDKVKLGKIDLGSLYRLNAIQKEGYSYAVKTHSPPSMLIPLFRKSIKATYTYRDPRDIVLSVLDHGRKARSNGISINLSDIHTLEHAVRFVSLELKKWAKWSRQDGVLLVKYEDMLANTMAELKRLANFLEIDVTDEGLLEIVRDYDRAAMKNEEKITNKTHFNKASNGRYLMEMSESEISYCDERFKPYLIKMGYSVARATGRH